MKAIELYRAGKLPIDLLPIIQKTPDFVFSLPRETYADNPIQLLRSIKNWPNGRGWELDLCLLDGVWVTRQETCVRTNKGYYAFDNKILVEMWSDYGEDGHTNMYLQGYVTICWTPGDRVNLRSIRKITQDMKYPDGGWC